MKRLTKAVLIGYVGGIVPLFGIIALQPRPPVVQINEAPRPVVSVAVNAPSFHTSSPTFQVADSSLQVPGSALHATATRILFVGDIMLDRNVAKRIKDSGDPTYPFRKLPDGWFDSFDYSVANLEGPVTDKRRSPEKSIDFMFDPTVIPTLKFEGIDAFSQANNHAFDQGRIGYDDSVRRLRKAGFLVFGEQVRDDGVAMATTTVNGLRFAFLGFNMTDNPLDLAAASSTIAHARLQADRVIVFIHWGIEYKAYPTEDVRRTAYWFIDHGVDVVIGGHPHWYQGIESYKNHPIVYSLGNFIFDQYFSTETQQGLTIELGIQPDKIVVRPIPIRLDASQPRVVEGAERDRRLKELADISDPALKRAIIQGAVTF